MCLDFRDNASFKYFTDRDRYEHVEITAFLQAVARHPDSFVIDVGANYGAFSLTTAASLGRAGMVRRIVAVEPDGRAFAALERSVRLNGFEHWISPRRFIASDVDGEETLFENARSSADNRTHAVGAATIRVRRTTVVPAITLDRLLREEGVVAGDRLIVKLDIQGNEFRALRGMRTTLDAARGFLLFVEHFPYLVESAGLSIDGYYAFMRQLGLTDFWEVGDGSIRHLRSFDEWVDSAEQLRHARDPRLQGAGTNYILGRAMAFDPRFTVAVRGSAEPSPNHVESTPATGPEIGQASEQ